MNAQAMCALGATVAQGSRAKEDCVLYCTSCGKDLLSKKAGDLVFSNQKNWKGDAVCDCSWNCCSAARPAGKFHRAHLAYKPQETGKETCQTTSPSQNAAGTT